MKRYLSIFLTFSLILVLTSCAHHYSPEAIRDPYGFFSGIWHGMILPITCIGSIFLDDVHMFGKPNTGFFYFLGVVIGFIVMPLGGAR